MTPDGTLEAGDTLGIWYAYYDSTGVTHSVLRLSGAASLELDADEQKMRTATRGRAVIILTRADLAMHRP